MQHYLTFLVHCQMFTGLLETEPFNETRIPVANLLVRPRCCRNILRVSGLHAPSSSPLQMSESEIPTAMGCLACGWCEGAIGGFIL